MTYTYQYPHMAVTVDLVLFDISRKTPQVLLIARRHAPYIGQWALPGGYVSMQEKIKEAAIRELKEETGANATDARFLGFYDAIDRDPRERTVSFAFWSTTTRQVERIMAADDATKAEWFSIDALPQMAFDHATIVSDAITAFQH